MSKRKSNRPKNRAPRKRGLQVQSLLMPKGKYTARTARTWASTHKFKASKVDLGSHRANYIRIRQFPPSRCTTSGKPPRAYIRTIPFGRSGIKATVCRMKA